MKGNCINVKCQICNLEISFGRIKRHINIKHKEITLEKYLKQYYQTLPLHQPCIICKENIIYKYQTCSKECHGILISSKLKGISKPEGFMDEKHKGKLSLAMLGSKGGFTGYKHTEEFKKSQRENCIKNKPHKGHKQSDYQKSQASKGMLKYYSEGNEPWTKNNKHTPKTISKIITHRPMNKLEEQVFNILKENNIKFKYQFFLNSKGIIKSFDFKIGKTLLEIDGDYWHGGPGCNRYFFDLDKTKENDIYKTNLAEEKGYKVIRIWESEIKTNPNIILQKLHNECL